MSNCKGTSCRTCNKKRHTLIDFENDRNNTETQSQETPAKTVNLHSLLNSEILLTTALVYINDNSGKPRTFRALLDSGSQSNYISMECANQLKIKQTPVNIPVAGIGQNRSTLSSIVRTRVKSQSSNYSFESSYLVIDKITLNLPTSTITIDFKLPSHIKLADPNFNISRPVDILIGAEIYSLLCIGQFKLHNQAIM